MQNMHEKAPHSHGSIHLHHRASVAALLPQKPLPGNWRLQDTFWFSVPAQPALETVRKTCLALDHSTRTPSGLCVVGVDVVLGVER